MRSCIECSREMKDNRRRICGSCRVKKARKTIKIRAVKHMGGKCFKCDYSKSIRALHFHHLDLTQKDFQISKSSNTAWLKVEEELKKMYNALFKLSRRRT